MSLERDQAFLTHDQHGAALNTLAQQGDDRCPRLVETDVVDVDLGSEMCIRDRSYISKDIEICRYLAHRYGAGVPHP